MRPSIEAHDALARLVAYPREGWADDVAAAARVVAADCPAAGELLGPFVAFAASRPTGELEEHFTRTFDNTDERALEVGWHAFGESYTRGSFMAALRRRLREHGVAESGELPDHLSHVLALLGRCDEAEAAALARDIVAPAVRKVHAALEGRDDPWTAVLAAVVAVLERHAAHAAHPARAAAASAPGRHEPARDEEESDV